MAESEAMASDGELRITGRVETLSVHGGEIVLRLVVDGRGRKAKRKPIGYRGRWATVAIDG